MMNVRRTKTALLWLLLLTSTASFAQSDGHFSDEDQESPTTEGNSGYSDDSQDNPTTENNNSDLGGYTDDEEENPSTSVQTVKGDDKHHEGFIYTIGGQLVGKKSTTPQLKKGVYIRNGKKFVMK